MEVEPMELELMEPGSQWSLLKAISIRVALDFLKQQ